jgi:monoterpene epsilon-lactone hydrolase
MPTDAAMAAAAIADAALADAVGADDGVVHVPAFDLPLSIYMSDPAKQAFRQRAARLPAVGPGLAIGEYRMAMDRHFYAPRLARALERFPAIIRSETIAGVRVDRVAPASGVAPENRHRVLLNLHGGGFRVGAGLGAQLESVPIAVESGIEVIAVDYRQGPEHAFPAASEDVAAVYHTLLERYRGRDIGVYGTSAGGALTAMTVAWLDRHNIPKPGAIALLSAPADNIWGGDSAFAVPPLSGHPSPPPEPNPPATGMDYVRPADLYDPLVSPAFAPKLLSRFPPALIITGTRAGELSAAVHSHTRLVAAGVQADLHVWDGMWHGFLDDIDLPEAAEARAVIARFWKRHLRG